MEIILLNTILYCNKWNETVEFYTKGIGLTILSTRDWFVELKLTDSARLSIANAAKSSIQSSGGAGITISMAVEDIHSTNTLLKTKGLIPTPIKHLWGSPVFYLYDPEGNRLEFWSSNKNP